MKNILNIIKEAWHNERGKALIKIGLWILFFIVMFALLNGGRNSSIKENPTTINTDNYEYNIVFNINNLTYNVEGIRYEEKELIEIKELNKEYINNFENIKELYNLDIRYLRLEVIENLIYNLTSIREISYNDGSKKVIYEVPSSDFKINDTDNYINNLKNKLEITYDSSNKITSATINLTNKMQKINKNIKKYQIKIDYKNIGNIKDFALD